MTMTNTKPKYTVGLIGQHTLLPVTQVLVSEDVGGIYAYLITAGNVGGTYSGGIANVNEIIDALVAADGPDGRDEDGTNHYVLDFDQDHREDFRRCHRANQFDLLSCDGVPIGYAIRNNPATIRLLHVLNGDPVEPLPKGWKYMNDVDRIALVGRNTFGIKADELAGTPGIAPDVGFAENVTDKTVIYGRSVQRGRMESVQKSLHPRRVNLYPQHTLVEERATGRTFIVNKSTIRTLYCEELTLTGTYSAANNGGPFAPMTAPAPDPVPVRTGRFKTFKRSEVRHKNAS
jgi:hypothetical protein